MAIKNKVSVFDQLERPLVFLDLETTGINPRQDRIVEISVLKVHPDLTEEEKTVRVNPGVPIPKSASDVHHITDEDVKYEHTFGSYAKSFRDFLDDSDLGGFNIAKFDLPLLRSEFKRVGIEFDWKDKYVIDSLTIFHQKEPRDLSAAYQKYCGRILEDAHGAKVDARASYDILKGQLDQHMELDESVASLHEFCNPKKPGAIGDSGSLLETDKGPIINFGNKHFGRLVSEVAVDDPGYLNWMLNNDFDPEVKQLISKALGR